MALITCGQCGTKVSEKASQCPHCGHRIESPRPTGLIRCPECQREVSPLAKACPHCGYPYPAETREDKERKQKQIAAAFADVVEEAQKVPAKLEGCATGCGSIIGYGVGIILLLSLLIWLFTKLQ